MQSNCSMRARRFAASLVAVSAVTAAIAVPSRPAGADQPCDAWDVQYTLAAKLQLTDTPMGAGNGIYPVGPGSVVLRYENVDGAPGGVVQLRAYAMREFFRIDSSALFWKTHVVTDTRTTASPDACGVIATGKLDGTTLHWVSTAAGYRTDGTLDCDGSLCGSFGAPPGGKSELHIPPHAVTLGPFKFAPDMKTFSMPSTLVSKTESPKQTAYLAFSGREARRTCVRVAPCP